MSRSPLRRGTPRRTLALITAGLLATGTLASVSTATAADLSSPKSDAAPASPLGAGRYIVVLEEESATGYDGGTRNLEATKKRKGRPFDADRPEVREYSRYLKNKQDKVAKSVGAAADKHFTLGSNAFTTDLTAKQAVKLSSSKEVLLLSKDTAYELDTWNTPDFLGLDGENGVWNQTGGPEEAGDGVVVGILDSGIWPESKSFAGEPLTRKPSGEWDVRRQGRSTFMDKADGGTFQGFCQTGDEWDLSDCNTKLIGARSYPEAFIASTPRSEWSPTEVVSPRDNGGHGSHTASTAAGNKGIDVTVDGVRFGEVSGMAPAAKIAAYKVCFDDNDPDTGGCYGSSTMAAVDDAIADGVDVINYSISGARDTVIDAVEFAFEGAAEAGIFVAASAGNSGPEAQTVAHNSPWLTTVAASTHTTFENTLVLGNGEKIKGASIATEPLASHPLVESTASKNATATESDARLCVPGSLDPAKVTGNIVVCTRGTIDRVAKSQAVEQAGGVGMVLVNVTPGSLDADLHSVPTVHVSDVHATTVFDYAATDGATASFEKGDTTGGEATPVPQMAPFSSRGPALANGADLIKPDITGPGVSVLAAVAPKTNSGRDYDLYSGTSMSSPHVAGLAAFMVGENPEWDPMTVKSAMMTTAYDVKDATGEPLTDPFAQGAGHVDPTKFFEPGLVVTSDATDWRRFIVGQGYPIGDLEPLAASQLNGPSIAQGEVTSTTTISRTFTGLQTGSWDVEVDLSGFDVDHKPTVEIGEVGDKVTVDFEFTSNDDAVLGEFSKGFVTLSGPTTVRMPVALRPVSVDAPVRADGTGTDGSVDIPVTAGFSGDLDIVPSGLAKAETVEATVAPGVSEFQEVAIAEGTKLFRADLDAANNGADTDLYLYRLDEAGEPEALVAYSATGAADESITVNDLEAGNYLLELNGYAAAPNESTIQMRSDAYAVDGDTVGDLTATPNPLPVVQGETTPYTASWSGLETDSRYLGYFEYKGALSPTYLYVDTQ